GAGEGRGRPPGQVRRRGPGHDREGQGRTRRPRQAIRRGPTGRGRGGQAVGQSEAVPGGHHRRPQVGGAAQEDDGRPGGGGVREGQARPGRQAGEVGTGRGRGQKGGGSGERNPGQARRVEGPVPPAGRGAGTGRAGEDRRGAPEGGGAGPG